MHHWTDTVLVVAGREQDRPRSIGFEPIVTVESIQGDASPLEHCERRPADLPRVHHDGGAELHLSDVAELDRVAEPGQQQCLRRRASEVTRADTRNQQEKSDTRYSDPERR